MRKVIPLGVAFGAALAMAPVAALAQSDQGPSGRVPSTGSSAAALSDGTINKAGAALRDVAQVQEKYQGKMDTASPTQKQSLSEQANAEAVQAIQSHGLSVQDYTNVVRTAQNNPQVKQRLLSAAREGKDQ